MNNKSLGVNYLYDVLFHEWMVTHPSARRPLTRRLQTLYEHYSHEQCLALDEVFSELFHQSFANVFQAQCTQGGK